MHLHRSQGSVLAASIYTQSPRYESIRRRSETNSSDKPETLFFADQMLCPRPETLSVVIEFDDDLSLTSQRT